MKRDFDQDVRDRKMNATYERLLNGGNRTEWERWMRLVVKWLIYGKLIVSL